MVLIFHIPKSTLVGLLLRKLRASLGQRAAVQTVQPTGSSFFLMSISQSSASRKQQVELHAISLVPADASEEATCRREGSLRQHRLAFSEPPPPSTARLGAFTYPAQRGAGLMARLPGPLSFLPPASSCPGPTYPTGALSGEFIHTSAGCPLLLSKHDHRVLQGHPPLGRHPSAPTLLITAPNCLLSYSVHFKPTEFMEVREA